MGVLIKVFNFFRVGFYHGYRVQKGGQKIFEEDALQNKTLGERYDTETKNITSFSVITNQTAADVNFCFRMVLAVYYHAATFEGLADEFNDTHSKGQDFI